MYTETVNCTLGWMRFLKFQKLLYSRSNKYIPIIFLFDVKQLARVDFKTLMIVLFLMFSRSSKIKSVYHFID